MDIMLKLFPDPEEDCPSHTEIPWTNIVLPRIVKIRSTKPPPSQKNDKDVYNGMFLSAESKSTDIDIILKANISQKTSVPIPVKGGAASQVTISVSSTASGLSPKPKRNGKDCSLCVRVSSGQIKSDGDKSKNNKEQLLAVIDPQCSTGKTVNPKKTNSLPAVPSKKSIKTNVHFNQSTGDSTVSMQTSKHSVSVTVRSSTDLPSKAQPKKPQPPKCACKSSAAAAPPPPEAKPAKQDLTKCSCKETASKSGFKQDAVAAALEVYESEMKPLKSALQQLQQKIRSLNVSEMNECWCKTTMSDVNNISPNLDVMPSCERASSSSPATSSESKCQCNAGSSYRQSEQSYHKKSKPPKGDSQMCACSGRSERKNGANSDYKSSKSSKKNNYYELNGRGGETAFRGCSETDLNESPSSTYKCPFTELAHSASSRTFSDDKSGRASKTKCGGKNNKPSGGKHFEISSKVSGVFDDSLFNSRRGIRTEPAKSSATIKTKIFTRSKKPASAGQGCQNCHN